jgi:broad specificity phosphatase PhoE
MLEIVLIQSGCTDYDLQRRIQGNLDVPLNEQGVAEVARVSEEVRGLGIETIYASCCEPAMQAGKMIAGALGVKFRKLDRMGNLNQGLWQGMLIEEVRLKQPKVYRQWQEHPENVCPPEGEMLSAAFERIEATVTKLCKRHKEGVIGLVAPQPLACLVRCFISHAQLGDLWKATEERCRWEVLVVNPEVLVHTS